MSILPFLTESAVNRFWKYTDKRGKKECWNWIGSCMKHGYGQLNSYNPRTKERTVLYAHRISWAIHNGEIPYGALICHHCDNKRCVNPNHFFLGNHSTNYIDMQKKKLWGYGEKCGSAKLKEKDVFAIMRLLNRGATSTELGMLYDVCPSNIRAVKAKKSWKHLWNNDIKE